MTKAKKQRTTEGLRDILFDEIDAMRGENPDPVRGRVVATLSREILSTARLELQSQEMSARMQQAGAAVDFRPLALGSK